MTRTLPERSGLPGRTGYGLPSEPPGFLPAYPGYASTALLDRLRATVLAYFNAPPEEYAVIFTAFVEKTYRDRVVGTGGLPPRRGC